MATSTAPPTPPTDLPTTIPPTTTHTHTVIFFHGRGGTASSHSPFTAFPSFRWVFSQAPTQRCSSLPATWPQCFNVHDTSDSGAREVTVLNGRWGRVLLAGISIGAATSVHAVLNLPDIPSQAGGRLDALLLFCGRCPFDGRPLGEMRAVLGLETTGWGDLSAVLNGTPVLLEHCADDRTVPVANGRCMRDTLRAFGGKVERCEYPEGGHWFCSPQGMDDFVAFVCGNVLGVDLPEVAVDADAMDMS
ncbi:Alpha/Beta hydrolase protein [Lasiosphaeria miniovina]|uniref:Alpha/Beta hydrolase protein n=1 Tax=Lasiosphaeria miniovina TaxID=1954250 RepID=A0AA40ECH3_9PEZI|nr:Alpha/Beta hydrolase protein [Lasiosphaeria miniovina]KAK0733237.1 Alpha/Beta hydrolase protein [Lasiosphaeria miniovina]